MRIYDTAYIFIFCIIHTPYNLSKLYTIYAMYIICIIHNVCCIDAYNTQHIMCMYNMRNIVHIIYVAYAIVYMEICILHCITELTCSISMAVN